jgi:hypothetical protein
MFSVLRSLRREKVRTVHLPIVEIEVAPCSTDGADTMGLMIRGEWPAHISMKAAESYHLEQFLQEFEGVRVWRLFTLILCRPGYH